jgi:hypothetical protein
MKTARRLSQATGGFSSEVGMVGLPVRRHRL